MKRFKHSLSNYKLLTCDMGQLVPCGMFHVLPGDAVQLSTSLLVRVSPLVAPVMHPVKVQIHHWYVPYRLCWSGWEDFITGVSEGPMPGFAAGGTGFNPNTNADYMGLPPGQPIEFYQSMPFHALAKIYNEFYRDQDLEAEVAGNNLVNAPPLKVNWEKDYFTTARPWAQKGGDVTIPLGVTAPVVPGTTGYPSFKTQDGINTGLGLATETGTSMGVRLTNDPSDNQALAWDDPQLVADLTSATAANINDVRRAFALQRYQEARAQYGSRYTEYLRYLGVRPSDARLQRPEYLGGGKSVISFSEILKTGSGEDPAVPLGTMVGHGISAMRSRRWRRFFEEHGVVLSLLSVRPRSMYTNGLHREWMKRTKEDYWQKELEHIGQQEVWNGELYAGGPGTGAGDADSDTWGYQDRYSEYRHIPSTVAGQFRDTLNYWHLARQFTQRPALNADFINCDPGKRVFAEQTQHALWIMAAHRIAARRMVTKSTIGRIV